MLIVFPLYVPFASSHLKIFTSFVCSPFSFTKEEEKNHKRLKSISFKALAKSNQNKISGHFFLAKTLKLGSSTSFRSMMLFLVFASSPKWKFMPFVSTIEELFIDN